MSSWNSLHDIKAYSDKGKISLTSKNYDTFQENILHRIISTGYLKPGAQNIDSFYRRMGFNLDNKIFLNVLGGTK